MTYKRDRRLHRIFRRTPYPPKHPRVPNDVVELGEGLCGGTCRVLSQPCSVLQSGSKVEKWNDDFECKLDDLLSAVLLYPPMQMHKC